MFKERSQGRQHVNSCRYLELLQEWPGIQSKHGRFPQSTTFTNAEEGSYWIFEECALGMESIEAWRQQMLKIKYMQHVANRTVGLFFWWWTLEFQRARGQLFWVNTVLTGLHPASHSFFKWISLREKWLWFWRIPMALYCLQWYTYQVWFLEIGQQFATPYNWLLNGLPLNGWMKPNTHRPFLAPESSDSFKHSDGILQSVDANWFCFKSLRGLNCSWFVAGTWCSPVSLYVP